MSDKFKTIFAVASCFQIKTILSMKIPIGNIFVTNIFPFTVCIFSQNGFPGILFLCLVDGVLRFILSYWFFFVLSNVL